MARKTTDVLLSTKTARLKLAVQGNPHYRTIQDGHALGYRRIANKAGTWVARRYDPDAKQPMVSRALGSADDFLPADGVKTLTYTDALKLAQAWFAELAKAGGNVVKPITVRDAMVDYVADYKTRSNRALKEMQTKIDAHILPSLGDKEVAKLTAGVISAWHRELANTAARLRGGKTRPALTGKETKEEREASARARRASANRILTVLKAALNLAFKEGRIASDAAWRRVPPFKAVDTPRVQQLTDEESVRLVEACPADLRAIVTAALLTGCDYSELATAKVSAVHLGTDDLHVGGKRGKRTISLSDEARRFFVQAMEDKVRDDLLFVRANGEPWGKSHQFRLLRQACERANITRPASEPQISFHILRHTYASRMLRRGMPMHQVSKQLGHKSMVITAKHYAHVLEADVAAAVKELSGELGIGPAPSPAPANAGAGGVAG